MTAYEPAVGDRVRVVLEGVVLQHAELGPRIIVDAAHDRAHEVWYHRKGVTVEKIVRPARAADSGVVVNAPVEKDAPIVLCGNGCGHDHESANGPSGCCTRKPEHGPYLYFCQPCHDDWAAASPERVAQIRRLAQRVTPSEVTR